MHKFWVNAKWTSHCQFDIVMAFSVVIVVLFLHFTCLYVYWTVLFCHFQVSSLISFQIVLTLRWNCTAFDKCFVYEIVFAIVLYLSIGLFVCERFILTAFIHLCNGFWTLACVFQHDALHEIWSETFYILRTIRTSNWINFGFDPRPTSPNSR